MLFGYSIGILSAFIILLLSNIFNYATPSNEISLLLITSLPDAVLWLCKLLLFLLLLILLLLSIGWLSSDEGMIILPFEAPSGLDGFDGKSLSNIFQYELQRISEIHKARRNGIKSEKLNNSEIDPRSERLDKSISDLSISVESGTMSLSIIHALIILKKLWPAGEKGSVITGSYQEFDSRRSLIIQMETQRIRSWETSCPVDPEPEDGIPELVRDVAYKMVHALSSDSQLYSYEWHALKYYSESLCEYDLYLKNNSIQHLNRSISNLSEIMKLRPYYENAYGLSYNLGICCLNIHNYDRALKLFDFAVLLEPDEPTALIAKGFAQLRLKIYRGAIESFEAAIQISSDYYQAWMQRGLAYFELKEYDNAIKSFEQASELCDECFDALYNIGLSHYMNGSFERALGYFNSAEEQNPQDKTLMNLIESCEEKIS